MILSPMVKHISESYTDCSNPFRLVLLGVLVSISSCAHAEKSAFGIPPRGNCVRLKLAAFGVLPVLLITVGT